MNVWLMNLKDNRDEANKPPDLTKSKFQFCLEHKILGIGWVNQEPGNAAFTRAKNAFSEFETGDLIWVKDSDTKEYYLCQITASVVSTQDEEWNRQDIGQYCACNFFRIGAAENLPEEIAPESLISCSTVSRANDLLSEQTKTFFDTVVKTPSAKKFPLKRLLLVCMAVVLLGATITAGFFLYKGIVRRNHPVLPYGLQMGDTYETLQKNLGINNPLDSVTTENKAGKYVHTPVKWPAEDFKAFYQNDHLTISSESVIVSYDFNQKNQLFSMSFILIDSDETSYKYLLDYYATALDVSVPEETDFCTLENKTLKADFFMTDIMISIRISSKALEPIFHEVPKSVINDAFNDIRYQVNGASINLNQLLSLCASGYEGEYQAYRDYLNMNILNMAAREELENGEYGDYLSTSYIVTIKGDITALPDSPYISVEEDADILTILMIFDENDQFIEYQVLQEHSYLYQYAVRYIYW